VASRNIDWARARPWLVVIGAVTLFLLVMGWRVTGDSNGPGPGLAGDRAAGAATETSLSPQPQTRVGYVVSIPGALYSEVPGGHGTAIAGGVVFAVSSESSGGYRVFDVCNREGWLASTEIVEGVVPVERGTGFEDAVFVIDPGHGFPDLGAVGPNRLLETEINLDVSERLAELLRSPRTVDWATGVVSPGSTIPAVAAVVLTRSGDGPNGGDYEAGLTFRATLGNSVDATALVSIHHNSGSATRLDHPGAEAYVSAFDPESARLGGLIVEELRRGLARFDAAWTGAASGSGVFARIGTDGLDYYTLLEQAEVPAVIVEGAYISNPSEEALGFTDNFRQSYAEAVYRALVRFVTTADDPIPAPDPETFDPGGPSRSFGGCQVPPLE
jgi:N-acetylmuramoyl-L-alanine amidase